MAQNNEQAFKGLALRIIIRVLSWFSLRNQHRVGAFLGWLVWVFPNREKRITLRNMELAFSNLSQAEQRKIARASLIEMGKTFTELGAIWGWELSKVMDLVDKTEAMADFDKAFALGRGVMVLAPHFGSWEIIGHSIAPNYPMNTMYRPPDIASLDTYIRKMRTEPGAKLWPTDTSGVRGLMKGLKDGEVVGILPDQEPGKVGGVIAPFFNLPANTMVLAAKLARRAQCPVFFAAALRLPKGAGYKLHLIPVRNEFYDEDEVISATELNRGVAELINLAPEQYQWSYKRYKGQKIKFYETHLSPQELLENKIGR